ncbi:hypothetical protein BUALT_Bualt01G0181300 [Buddleja alternifolia]|uniref:Uncharacterized protein n=1 Tax=Buddleja alternifolia TaxID=168488 RepID=A0AAV6Y884_9LAMI|nr:hypothetical protein BUALT_Bualt01G0181300 [Buddleja alternifolia]
MMEDIQREQANSTNNDVRKADLKTLMPLCHSLRCIILEVKEFTIKRSRSQDNLTIMTDNIKEVALVIGNEIAKASEVFSKTIGVDVAISKKRQKMDSEIRKIPNLTINEIIKVVSYST